MFLKISLYKEIENFLKQRNEDLSEAQYVVFHEDLKIRNRLFINLHYVVFDMK